MARRKLTNRRGRGLGSATDDHEAQASNAYRGAELTVSNMPVMCYGAINKIAQASAEIAAARAHAWAAVNSTTHGGRQSLSTLIGKINKLQKKLQTITADAQDRCKGTIR